MSAPPSWEDLSARANTALASLRTLEARVSIVEPERGTTGPAHARSVRARWASPDFWRIDDDEGPLVIRDGRDHIERDADGKLRHHHRDADYRPDHVLGLGWGHPRLFLEPEAFRDPVGGPQAAVVAGRPAWAVTLAAPGNKPYQLVVMIDQATGLLMGHRAEGTPYRAEVLELHLDEDLPDDTFAWSGPVERESHESRRAAEELHILDALLTALNDPRTLCDAIAQASDPEAARQALRETFNFDELQARAVSDAQFRRLDQQSRAHIAQRQQELRQLVAETPQNEAR